MNGCPRIRTADGTIYPMRSCGLYLLLLLTGFSLPGAAANICVAAPRMPGTPIQAPHAVFEAYVVEISAQRALVEVVRSYHGPYGPGQQVETLAGEKSDACVSGVESGSHVLVRSEFGRPFAIVARLPQNHVQATEPFDVLALAEDERRPDPRPPLKNALLRGDIDVTLAAHLYERASPDQRARCEISQVGSYAQVSWGEAFGGNDARHKVIFEHVDRGWVEILRYQAPAPTPARNGPRRARQRALWAQETETRVISQVLDDASAG